MDSIRHEASEWLAKRRDDTRALADEHAFRAWRDADPRHAKAYEAMARTFEDVAAMRELAELEPLEAPAPKRRGFFYAASGVAAIAAAALLFLAGSAVFPPAPIAPHATQVAETETLRLDDGSLITLGAASAIDVRFTSTERLIVILAGEAFFDVADDPARPFVVVAGDAVIRDIGTQFNVNRGGASVRVSVLEGVVEVQEPAAGLTLQRPAPVVLRAGERAEVRDAVQILGATEHATPVRAIAPGSWREGRLVYDDVSLGDLVADLNRYYGPGVRVGDPRLADLRLAASFRANEIETFLATLPSAVPVEVERSANGAVTLSGSSD